jgi:TatD DNase family protein
MFDTHTHLNFSRFKGKVGEVVANARAAGVVEMVIPGTDFTTSQSAIAIAHTYEQIYVAVGIHPHHVYELKDSDEVGKIESLLNDEKVVAVGELGMDRHEYKQTKYEQYSINDSFIDLQKELVKKQLKLAIQYDKSVILHNREAKEDLLPLLTEQWDEKLRGRAVLHCCEPDGELLSFAKEYGVFIGVDGDITYTPEKQEFIKTVPLDMLVLETDSPFLLPEPLRTQKKFPNEPKNLVLISEFIASILNMDVEELRKITRENGRRLFAITD